MSEPQLFASVTEEQRLLKEMLASFFRDEPARLADDDFRAWNALAGGLGAGGLLLPEAMGGAGGGATEAAILMFEAGYAGSTAPILDTIVMAGALERSHGCVSAADLAGAVAAGEARLAWAWIERHGRFEPATIAMRAEPTEGGYRLHGEKIAVFGAPDATDLLVVARTSGAEQEREGLSLFRVDPTAPGVSMRGYRAIDGTAMADLRFDGVEITQSARIGNEGAAWPILDDATALGVAGVCAEMSGVLRRMIDLTVDHVRQREQFGKPLAAFQALRHHLVDAWIVAEQAQSMAGHAAAACSLSGAERDAAMSAAKLFLGRARQTIGRYAIQFHGAMGTTDEAAVSRFFKRATVLETRFGGADHHLARYLSADVRPRGEALLSSEDAAFRDEVRAALAEMLDDDLRERVERQAGFICEPDLHRDWQARLYARGWDVPNWPTEHGGTGWTPVQRYIFQSELAAAGAPFGAGMGINLCAPVLIAFGTDEQKAFFLPRIRTGEHYWAQGFSEPGAGSDLASLQLRAIREGDHYVLNGSKIWTTHAHHANWIFLLLRTSIEDRKQAGLSFLLCPLDRPGIMVRPIASMSGEHEVNQVFFDDVRVPIGNLVGEEGQGWEMARYLLGFERGGRPFGAGLWRRVDTLRAMAAAEPGGCGGRLLDDAVFRHRLAETEVRLLAADATERRLRMAQAPAGTLSVASASQLKLLASERTQEVQELTMDALGPYAAADQRDALEPDVSALMIGPGYARTPTARYLNGRAYSIFGGASEVQRDILSRAALDL